MPLTERDLAARRNMSPDAQRNQDIFRSAEALEKIALALDDIADAYLAGLGRQRKKEPR